LLETDGSLAVDINAADIQIGAVEIKNGTDDTRAAVGSGVAANALRSVLATDVGLPAGTSAIGKVGHDTTGLGHGIKTVTAAGTDEALAASTAAKWVVVQAQTDNTSAIAVGASGVDATVATGTGLLLYAGESITLQIDNLADVFVDALVSGEGVRYLYGT